MATVRSMVSAICLVLTASAQLAAQARCTAPWTLRETLRVGSIDGPDALAGVLHFDVSKTGDLYVVQPFVPSISVFAPNGKLSRTIGRAGNGPGEFATTALRVGWWRDTLWVSDLRAIHFFDRDGSETRQVRFSAVMPQAGSRFTPGVPLADGSFLGSRSLTGEVARFFEGPEVPLPRFSATGQSIGTIASIRQRLYVKTKSGAFMVHPLGGSWDNLGELPFALTTDGSAVLFVGDIHQERRGFMFDILRRRSTFEILKVSITGDTLLKTSIEYSPRPITRSAREWLTEAIAGFAAGDYDTGSNTLQRSEAEKERARQDTREVISFPQYYPPVRRIVAGHDGSIWLLREIEIPDLTDRWEVYDGSGRLEGVVNIAQGRSSRLPWDARLHVFRASRQEVWGTTVDELDVTYIHRYAVVRGC